MRSVGPGSSLRPLARHLRLPLRLADFANRGFALDRPVARRILETHARAFLTGFNVVAGWRDPHRALAGIPDEERGFAYEGAGMRAALTDLATGGHARAFERLLAGPGQGYVHLVHVGYGWGLVPTRLPLPVLVPRTPLLRWLALDGAGFAEVYFGGVSALRRRCARAATPRWEARLAGCGRALWFLTSADVDKVAGLIGSVPLRARSPLWAGVGLAAVYAGCVDEMVIDRLVAVCGEDVPRLKQGALFAIAARCRSGIVPAHTELACRRLFSVSPGEAASWTDTAAAELTGSRELAAYLEWKSRLRTAHVRLS